MKDSIRLVAVLAIIAMISGGLLSYIYGITDRIVAENRDREMGETVLGVVPQGDAFSRIAGTAMPMTPEEDPDAQRESSQRLDIFEVTQAGRPVGLAVAGQSPGYNGPVRVMIGFSLPGNQITGIQVLSHTETPGLGSRIEDRAWLDRFIGQSVTNVRVDNISGATVSAQAVIRAVREAGAQALEEYR